MALFDPETIARTVHAANRELQRALGEEVNPEWDDLPEHMRDGLAVAVVNAQDGITPERSHEAWMAHRLADRWTFGPVKNLEHKTSPNLIPYADLPPEQKAKDALVLAIVGALTAPIN